MKLSLATRIFLPAGLPLLIRRVLRIPRLRPKSHVLQTGRKRRQILAEITRETGVHCPHRDPHVSLALLETQFDVSIAIGDGKSNIACRPRRLYDRSLRN